MEASKKNSHALYNPNTNYTRPLIIMVLIFHLIGAVTVLNDILIPQLKEIFELSNAMAMMVQSFFFGAYFVMGVPSGWLVNKIGYTRGVIVGLIVLASGMLLFVPASGISLFGFYLFALFVIGSGLSILQTACNPYTAACGKPENTGMRMNLSGAFNSLATTIMPIIGSLLIFVDGSNLEKLSALKQPYIGLALIVLSLAVLLMFRKLPKVIDSEINETEESEEVISPWKFSHLVLGAFAIFFYVGGEVACGSILIDFLGQESMGGLDKVEATPYVSIYWGGLMVGRFLGIFFLKYFKIHKALATVAALALTMVLITIFTDGAVAKWALCSIGLCCSIMWPCIFPLGIAGLGKSTGKGSGLMVTMVVGGAIIPPLQGLLADTIGYNLSFTIVVVCFAYVLFYALIGHKVRHPKALENLGHEE
jgi:FHS family L-fucose permease-like MFS transporter